MNQPTQSSQEMLYKALQLIEDTYFDTGSLTFDTPQLAHAHELITRVIENLKNK